MFEKCKDRISDSILVKDALKPDTTEAEELEITPAVYLFFVEDSFEGNLGDVLSAFQEFKKREDKNAKEAKARNEDYTKESVPKINENNSFASNRCLYIGSVTSEKLLPRLKEHFYISKKHPEGKQANKNNQKGTAALKIPLWWKEETVLPLRIYYFNMDGVDSQVVQLFEDCLSEMYKPLLGKRGSSPKGQK
ncbi:MAG: hypothetical protein WCR04_10920 [Fibrobacteraceae bacterium]